MITIEGLTKKFTSKGEKTNKKIEINAVDHINLEINEGEIFGLIGPNGAGKTTILKMLSTLIIPDEGSATVNGYDIVKDAPAIKREVSLLAGEFTRSLYWRLSGRENLVFFAKLRNIWNPDKKINELIKTFNLAEHQNNLVMKYSTGMKHKLALAVGLLHDPPVIFLDEPLTGIDPVTSYEIKNLIKNKFKNKTIIWASHNLYEIEEMCDRIALINKGKIVLDGTPDKVKKSYLDYEKIILVTDKPEEFKIMRNAIIKEDIIEIKTVDVNSTFLEIMELVKKKNIKIIEIKTLKPSLEEIFMKGIQNAK